MGHCTFLHAYYSIVCMEPLIAIKVALSLSSSCPRQLQCCLCCSCNVWAFCCGTDCEMLYAMGCYELKCLYRSFLFFVEIKRCLQESVKKGIPKSLLAFVLQKVLLWLLNGVVNSFCTNCNEICFPSGF